MILITGAAGFIGSYLTGYLNAQGIHNIILSDDFGIQRKHQNYKDKKVAFCIDRSDLFKRLGEISSPVEWVIHLGARTDTVSRDRKIFHELNLEFSKSIWQFCTENKIPLIYASSAATYGDGSLGFDDTYLQLEDLKPLNEYAKSKHAFDLWASASMQSPPVWIGLKFFNVYGPNEYHKGRMASVIYHAFQQIKDSGTMNLFRSHHPDIGDGEQQRDFIYVKDICEIIMLLVNNPIPSGIYNLGTGSARTFHDLVRAVFNAMGKDVRIKYIDIPEDIRNNYQYFTEASMEKLTNKGIKYDFTPLEEGIHEYVSEYLMLEKYY